MIPVLIILGAWWAVSGVVSYVKERHSPNGNGARLRNPASSTAPQSSGNTRAKRRSTGTGTDAPNADTSTRRPPHLGDVTFRQWQASMFRRWKLRVRSHLPGQRLGRRAIDLAGDITAASIAGAAVFGAGFISGSVWAGARLSTRSMRNKAQGAPKTSRRNQAPRGGQQQPGNPLGSADWPTGFGFGPGPHYDDTQNTNKPRSTGDADVIDAELLDDTETPGPPASPFVSDEYADVVGQPQLLAYYPEPRSGDPVSEILTIHQLFDFSKTVITQATETAEQDAIRANSASERAEQASNRSLTAGNRAEQAGLIAGDATSQATQLEETAARFSSLNMDSASLASMTTVIEAANTHATDKRRRAEAEANVAAIAAALAQAEEEAAAAAAASAKSAINLVEAAKGMHDTVQAHQMPHAEAQAATGNAAAHASVLAVS